jgi:hypothetical protein
MTRFRFRYKCMSFRRWRYRASRRRTRQQLTPLVLADFAPGTPAWRRRLPTPVLLAPTPKALRVGDYLVGEEGDLQLYGHPNIRY